jgi:thiol-disulfide isomerase/thioredoxin
MRRAKVRGGAVQVKFFQSVVIAGLAAACTTPAREPSPQTVAVATPSPSSPPPIPALSPDATASSATPTPPSPPPKSAYAGCGQPLPAERLWDETTEREVEDAIAEAKACASEHGRRLLLEFVAPWCDDCQEMSKLDEAPEVARTLRERFERVRVNVGKWDRHEALRQTFGVKALATYIVLEPRTSQVVARTTLEPITKPGQKLSADDWRRWLAAH